MRKRDKERFGCVGGGGGSKTEARVWLGVRERLAGRRVAQSERYCLGLNVPKAKRMMPGEAGGPAWLSGSRGGCPLQDANM